MAISEPRYRFHRVMVSGAPESGGLYALWHGAEMVFLGRAASIRDALLEHLPRMAERATHYSWHVSLRAAGDEVDLLQELQVRGGPMPRFNREAA